MKKISSIIACILLLQNSITFAFFETSDSGYVVGEEGTVYTQSDCTYTEKGNFSVGDYVGYNEQNIKVSSGTEGDEVTFYKGITTDYYEVYYWKNVFEDGDKNATYTAYANGLNNTAGNINFSEGLTGWESLGVIYCTDGHINVTVTANDGKISASAIKLEKRDMQAHRAYYVFNQSKNAIVMKVGSRNTICNKQKIRIDDTAPEITNDLTFVPVRFVTENMKGEVEWIAAEKKVKINLSEHEIIFQIGSREYSVDGNMKELETVPYIKNGRTMIPLRAMSEGAEKTVKWNDCGLIVICDRLIISDADYPKFVEAANEMLKEEEKV